MEPQSAPTYTVSPGHQGYSPSFKQEGDESVRDALGCKEQKPKEPWFKQIRLPLCCIIRSGGSGCTIGSAAPQSY